MKLNPSWFDYNPQENCEVRLVSSRESDGQTVETITYLTPDQIRRAAYRVLPGGQPPYAACLWVHWYEPQAPDSNRQQFLPEAIELAHLGVASLLVETLWSDRDWFIKRTQAEDFDDSCAETRALRRALDLLLSVPGVDAHRLAYVGHDFGAMYGVLLGAVDPRPRAYVLMAGAPVFADWYLYYPPLEERERQEYLDRMTPLDPVQNVSHLAPMPLLFQFGDDDPHVPLERAEVFFTAAAEPREQKIYPAGHELNETARKDRIEWLSACLGLV